MSPHRNELLVFPPNTTFLLLLAQCRACKTITGDWAFPGGIKINQGDCLDPIIAGALRRCESGPIELLLLACASECINLGFS